MYTDLVLDRTGKKRFLPCKGSVLQDFHQLAVWQKAHDLALHVYAGTSTFPEGERFGLTSQMRRSAASVPTNIAEGCGRNTSGDLSRYLSIALGSASELEYQLLLAKDLGFMGDSDYEDLVGSATEVKRMLAGFLQRVRCS